MLKLKTSDTEFQFEETLSASLLNGVARVSDVVKLSATKYHLLLDEKSYTVELLERDESGKNLRLAVNGIPQQISISDKYDALLKQLGMENIGAAKAGAVKAPMPGLVLQILVTEGDVVKKGDSILVLEAMKMENSIKAPSDGVVKKIHAQTRQAVYKNQLLMEME